MRTIPATPEAYDLLHKGSLVLSRIEHNGMRVDMPRLRKTLDEMQRDIAILEEEFMDTDLYKEWKRACGRKFNFNSRQQLAHVLFNVLGYQGEETEKSKETDDPKKKRFKADESALERVDHPAIKTYIRRSKLTHLRSHHFNPILREATAEGFVHASFNLNLAASYRSQCEDPNLQNIPIRDPVLAQLIRGCYIARSPKHQIVEVDFSGIEVRVAACYHKDPTMITYIKDKTKDMHRDMAAQCYMLKPEQVDKAMRYCGKNMFVFPQFYGDFYLHCAKSLWEAIEMFGGKGLSLDGKSLYRHLRKKGITELGPLEVEEKPPVGTFMRHIKEVEQDFWQRRFRVYGAWKKSWFKKYQQTGSLRMLSGFNVHGHLTRNEVINYPVQGAAFHCLLWCLIRIDRWLRKNRMKTRLTNEIHDSVIGDVYKPELEDYLGKLKEIMTVDLPRAWDWLIVPLEVEAEVAPLGGSWADKKGVEIP